MQPTKKTPKITKPSLKTNPTANEHNQYNIQKLLLQQQLEIEKEKYQYNKKLIIRLKQDERKLDQDCLKYAAKMCKGKEKILEIKKNVGNTDFFLQQNPHISQLIEQMIIQKTTQEGNPNELNPDNMSYEQLLELGEQIGKVSKGLKMEQIQSLKRTTYRKLKGQIQERCSVCYQEYKPSDCLIHLKCCHAYHEQCLIGWLKEQKICPLCKDHIMDN